VWYEKKTSVLVDDFQDKKLTGVRPGTRKFEIPGQTLFIPTRGGVARDIKGGSMLLNGAPEGSDFVVESNGVVTVTFVYSDDFKRDSNNIPVEGIAVPVVIK
jgi:hypothetical protein